MGRKNRKEGRDRGRDQDQGPRRRARRRGGQKARSPRRRSSVIMIKRRPAMSSRRRRKIRLTWRFQTPLNWKTSNYWFCPPPHYLVVLYQYLNDVLVDLALTIWNFHENHVNPQRHAGTISIFPPPDSMSRFKKSI